ncbi:MAG TPA: hypothetical protein VJU61_15970 [Polyangiaceae bacterium]|nr:hypothetical protein [Polyangiaceae bacterium]
MGNLTRRHILLAALAVLADAHGGPSLAQAAELKVYVFAVTSIRPHVLQKMLETSLPGMSVSVFGRVGDFSRALEDAPPAAALANSPVLAAFGQKPEIQGLKNNSPQEDYLVVSEDDVKAEALADLTIGCLDLIGRKGLPAFVASLLGIQREPAIQRVTKTEDLLQLLQFKRAGAILIPERFLSDLQARTKMDLKILRLPSAKMLRVGIAFPGNRQAVEGPIRALPAAVLEQLGVDHWR